jgi:glutathione S-transferase
VQISADDTQTRSRQPELFVVVVAAVARHEDRRDPVRGDGIADLPAGGAPSDPRLFGVRQGAGALLDGDIRVWESLAIIEYVAEKFPAAGLWPQDAAERAHARAIANEMHGGFLPLRRRCPMNMRRPPGAIEIADDVRADVARIEAIWSECRARSAARGAFLFGAFGAADAMFAPVVSRFHTYRIAVGRPARDYMAAVMDLPAWSTWAEAAAVEPWVLPEFEIAGLVEPARG